MVNVELMTVSVSETSGKMTLVDLQSSALVCVLLVYTTAGSCQFDWFSWQEGQNYMPRKPGEGHVTGALVDSAACWPWTASREPCPPELPYCLN